MTRLAAILFCLAPWNSVAGQEFGVVAGTVVDDRNRPLRGSVVSLIGLPSIATLTDSDGRFLLRIPSGEHIVRAQLLGHEFGLHFIGIGPGDSIQIEIQLPPQAIVFGGVDLPLAPVHLQAAARSLVEVVLRDTATQSLIQAEFGKYHNAPIRAWIPWLPGGSEIGISGRNVEITTVCEGCSAANSTTAEAGFIYTARTSHIRLGITAPGVLTPIVTLCLGAALPGDRLMPNCIGGRGGLRFTFAQSPEGAWIRIQQP